LNAHVALPFYLEIIMRLLSYASLQVCKFAAQAHGLFEQFVWGWRNLLEEASELLLSGLTF